MKKSTKVLIAVLVLLGIVYAIQRLTYTTSTTENSNPFAKIDTSKISKITISDRSTGKRIVIARETGRWFIVNPLHFPADKSQINLLLSAIASNPSASVVADNLTDTLAYGLGENAPMLTISENDQKQISLRIGNVTPDFDGCYLEKDGNKKVLDLTKNIRSFAAQPLTDWRDKQIFDFTFGSIQTADFSIGDTLYHFVRSDTSWQVNDHVVPLTKVEDVVGDFIGTMAMDFVDTSITGEKTMVDFGFSLANGLREAGSLTKLGNQTYVYNSTNGQTYVIGGLIADDLVQGLREIHEDYLSKKTPGK